jgi:heptosyltransferase-1
MILLLKPGSMGDVIHALPVVAAIHRSRPEVRVCWVIDPRWAPLLEGNPGIAEVVHFPRESFRGVSGIFRAGRWYAGLRRLRPETVLDLQGLLRSALMARLSGGKILIGLGDAREGAGLFYHQRVDVLATEHAVDRYLRILAPLGISRPEVCEFPLPAGTRPPLPDRYIVLHPFARGVGKSMGDAEIRAFLAEFSRTSSLPVVLVGFGASPSELPSSVINLTGKTSLLELVGILRGSRFTVSVDSGPMHLAAALQVPMLGIHTWSNPGRVGPYSSSAWIWQGGEIRLQDYRPLQEVAFSAAAAREIARLAARESDVSSFC